jgi:predicted naringenin-chalcone synthase
MEVRILGVGTAVPNGVVSQHDAARLALETCVHDRQMAAALPALYEHTQIQTRHSVLVDSSSNGQPATQSFFPAVNGPGDRGPTTATRMRRYEAEAAELAALAVGSALENAGCDADEITHLVTVSCSGFSAPGFDVGLIERLGMRRDVARTHVGFMGCHGALNGMRVAAAFAKARPANRVLLCCRDLQHPPAIPTAIRSSGGQRAVQ